MSEKKCFFTSAAHRFLCLIGRHDVYISLYYREDGDKKIGGFESRCSRCKEVLSVSETTVERTGNE